MSSTQPYNNIIEGETEAGESVAIHPRSGLEARPFNTFLTPRLEKPACEDKTEVSFALHWVLGSLLVVESWGPS